MNGNTTELLSTAADSITTPRGRDSMNGPGDAVWILISAGLYHLHHDLRIRTLGVR